MTKPWLVIDGNNECHRVYHASGHLHHDGEPTGMIFGVMRDVTIWQKNFNTDRVAFCFDRGPLKRKKIDPGYKLRKATLDEDGDLQKVIRQQIALIRDEKLAEVGFRNIYVQKGYEADDLIAAFCEQHSEKEIIIISGDHDLYQLLTKRISIYHPGPKVLITRKSFIEQYRVKPSQWAAVKSIAGCRGDKVKGIKGVGEITAIKYIRGELNITTGAHTKIIKQGKLTLKNLTLVRLPFPGTMTLNLHKDEITPKTWKRFLRQHGIKSLDQLSYADGVFDHANRANVSVK